MTNYQHKKGNRIVKYALLNLIADIMKTNVTAHFVWMDEGYENDNQRIHFTSEGHKCMLVGVGCPYLENADLPLTVITKWDGEENAKVDVTLNISKIHINTLEKIACEVYNTLWNPEVDDDYDLVRDEYVSGYLDTNMGQ